MAVWHLAPSLARLRAEINDRWPNRDRASDGSIGDAAHSASASDHNPNARGSVNAIDIDKDGVDIAAIIAAAERHPSVHYWIFNRQIADRDGGFRRIAYSGPNPHDKHLHISIRQTAAAENDERSWGLEVLSTEDKAWIRGLVEAERVKVWTGVSWNGESAAVRLAKAASAAGKVDALDLQMDAYAADDASRDADLPAKVREALGAGQSPEQVAAALKKVQGVDWAAVGRAMLSAT